VLVENTGAPTACAPLSGLVDEVLRELAPRGIEGERCAATACSSSARSASSSRKRDLDAHRALGDGRRAPRGTLRETLEQVLVHAAGR